MHSLLGRRRRQGQGSRPTSADFRGRPGPAPFLLSPCAMTTDATRDQILVVDDDPGVRDAFDALLGEDYDVRQASDVAGALAHLATGSPRLVFLDLRLKNESGLDLLRRLAVERPRLPVVMVTAAVDEGVIRQGQALGAGLLRKPFDVAEVEAIARASTCIR
jgi:DNA-binding response OmpR family regulator